MREIKKRTTRKVSSREHQQRMATAGKYMEKQKTKIDMHDLLHSLFWSVPTRDELKQVRERLDKELASQRVNHMDAEVEEAIEMGMGTHYR